MGAGVMTHERPPADRATFPAVLAKLFEQKHTGPVIVHFAQGHPNVIEVPGAATRIVLDKRRSVPET
jgi:hypothetical protein